MTTVSYTTLLSKWFHVYLPFSKKSNSRSIPRTGYAAAYPKIKSYHRRPWYLFSCISSSCKSNKNINQAKISKTNSSIRGCASFARFDSYCEGESDDDC